MRLGWARVGGPLNFDAPVWHALLISVCRPSIKAHRSKYSDSEGKHTSSPFRKSKEKLHRHIASLGGESVSESRWMNESEREREGVREGTARRAPRLMKVTRAMLPPGGESSNFEGCNAVGWQGKALGWLAGELRVESRAADTA